MHQGGTRDANSDQNRCEVIFQFATKRCKSAIKKRCKYRKKREIVGIFPKSAILISYSKTLILTYRPLVVVNIVVGNSIYGSVISFQKIYWISKYLPRFDGAGIQYFTSGSYMRQSFSPKCFFFPGSCGDDTDECDSAIKDHQCEHFKNVNFISNR